MDEKIKELLEQINSELHCLSMRIKEAAEEANANMLKLLEYQQTINAVRRIFGLKG